MSDPAGRPTIGDYLRRSKSRLYPVGRLDFNSSGLILLTNDGELACRLMHPRYGIHKVYRVKVGGVVGDDTLSRLRGGVKLEDGFCRPVAVRVEQRRETKSWLEITVAEGRQHLIKRLCAAVGHPVEKLARTAVGPVRLGKLKPGESRVLTQREVMLLRRATGLA